jgi:hypothetical protein
MRFDSLDLLAPLFFAAAGLVIASGIEKLRRPGPAARALQAVRLPSGVWTARAIGIVEALVGLLSMFAPSRWSAGALAILYAAFAAFLLLLIRAKAPGATCGCLGSQETPPSLLHLGLDVAAATTAGVVALAPPAGIVSFSTRLPLFGFSFLLGTALIAYLAYLVAAYLPQMFSSYAGRRSESDRSIAGRPFAARTRESA